MTTVNESISLVPSDERNNLHFKQLVQLPSSVTRASTILEKSDTKRAGFHKKGEESGIKRGLTFGEGKEDTITPEKAQNGNENLGPSKRFFFRFMNNQKQPEPRKKVPD